MWCVLVKHREGIPYLLQGVHQQLQQASNTYSASRVKHLQPPMFRGMDEPRNGDQPFGSVEQPCIPKADHHSEAQLCP